MPQVNGKLMAAGLCHTCSNFGITSLKPQSDMREKVSVLLKTCFSAAKQSTDSNSFSDFSSASHTLGIRLGEPPTQVLYQIAKTNSHP